MTVPSRLNAGDTWSWTDEYPDYPADVWTLDYYFENTAAAFTVPTTAVGTGFEAAVDAVTTAALIPGSYRWAARVTSGATKYTVVAGWLEVLADPAAAAQRDFRTHARKMLDAIEAFEAGAADGAQLLMISTAFGGRSATMISPLEREQYKAQLRGQVGVEETGASAGLGRQIRVRYGTP